MSDAAGRVTEPTMPQEIFSGGHLVAKALRNEGVDVIFTFCGGHIIDIYDGCLDEGIKIVDVRHERVAVHAADGYARQTGKPGRAAVTAGPGTTNAMTGFDTETANRFNAPFLAVSGQIMKYGEQRGNVGNMLGDVPFEAFAEMLGGYGEGVREPGEIGPALERAREAVKSGKSAVVSIWVDPNEYAPGTKAQTMYK